MSPEKMASEVDTRLDDLFGEEREDGEPYEDQATAAAVSSRLDDLFGEDPSQSGQSNPKPVVTKPSPSRDVPKKEKKSADIPVIKPLNTTSEEKPLLNELKSIVMSLEWEITDQLMQKLEEELKSLEDKCKDDKIVVGFLQLINSLGKYIRKKKADAHPDSLVLLRSVFDSLEKVVVSQELSEVGKKKMLVVELNKYKELKSQLLLKPEASRKAEVKPIFQESISRPPLEEVVQRQIEEETVSSSAEIPPFSLAEHEQVVAVEDYGISPSSEVRAGKSFEPETTATYQDIIRALEDINMTIKTEFSALIAELRLWREKQ